MSQPRTGHRIGRHLGLSLAARNRVDAVAAAAIFVFAVHWSYRLVIAPNWAHAGLIYQPTADGSLPFAMMLAILPSAFLPLRSDRVSTICLWTLYAVPYVPASLVPHYVLGEGWSLAPLNLALLAGILAPAIVVRLPIPELRVPAPSRRTFGLLLAASGILAGAVLVAVFGLGSLPGLSEIYDTRAEYKDRAADAGRLVGYLVGTAGTVIFPALIVLGLWARRYVYGVLGLIGILLLYSITGYRSALFAVPLAVAIYILSRFLSRRLVTIALIGFSLVIGIAVLVELTTGSGTMSALLIRRTLSVPGQLTGYYFDYFSTHEPYHLAHSALGWLSDPPNALPPPRVVSTAFFGNPEANANANLWADGFANFRIIGVVAAGVLLGAVLWVGDAITRFKPLSLAAPVLVVAIFSLANSALLTSLLSHGIVAALVTIALLPDAPADSGDQETGLVPAAQRPIDRPLSSGSTDA